MSDDSDTDTPRAHKTRRVQSDESCSTVSNAGHVCESDAEPRVHAYGAVKSGWSPIPKYPKYEANASGAIRNKSTGRVVKPSGEARRVRVISNTGSRYAMRAGRCVLSALFPNIEPGDRVDHTDGDLDNHEVYNLTWVSKSELIWRRHERRRVIAAQIAPVAPTVDEIRDARPETREHIYGVVRPGWHGVPLFPKYEAHACGLIRNKFTRHILTPSGPIRCVSLATDDGRQAPVQAARVVLLALFPDAVRDQTVDHVDGNPDNHDVFNLQWCSIGENARRAHVGHPMTKLTARLRSVRQFTPDMVFIREFPSVLEAARAVGACSSGITDCSRGRRKTIAGFKWRYTEQPLLDGEVFTSSPELVAYLLERGSSKRAAENVQVSNLGRVRRSRGIISYGKRGVRGQGCRTHAIGASVSIMVWCAHRGAVPAGQCVIRYDYTKDAEGCFSNAISNLRIGSLSDAMRTARAQDTLRVDSD